MNKAFTKRLVRCFLVGFGAFVMILAVDITIRSPLDGAGYVLGIGALWCAFEVFIVVPSKRKAKPKTPPPQVVPKPDASKQAKTKPSKNPLGEDHFD